MSLLDKVSLALIPSAYKASKAYSIIPANGDGDFDFSRASSATRVNENGLIETVGLNVPRIDYSDGGCPSLLLEPQRTNLVTYSEDLDDVYWTKSEATITSDATSSPVYNVDADKIVESSATNRHYIGRGGITKTASSTVTFSGYVKPNGREHFTVRLYDSGSAFCYIGFDASNGNMTTPNNAGYTNVSSTMTEVGNGWYRFTFTATTSSFTTIETNIYLATSLVNINQNYLGDGTSGIYVIGLQLEQGSYPTSYIPTSGSTSTRNIETCNGAGNVNTFNDSEGVLFAEISALADDGGFRVLSLNDTGTDNRVYFEYSSVSNRIRAVIQNSLGNQAILSHIVSDVSEVNKLAVKYKENDFALWVNGIEVDTDDNGSILVGLNKLSFDRGDGLFDFFGNTKQIQYFDTALTDQELQELTTL